MAPVPNGDLADGLTGWGQVGPTMTLEAGPIIVASDNTTVLTPSFTVAAGAQVVLVSLGVPGANAVVGVRARPDDGGADVSLITVTPDRGVRTFAIPVGAVAGRSVRLVLDPVTSLGRRLLVGSVGPVRWVLPGWSVGQGLPIVGRAWGRSVIRVSNGRVQASTPAVALSPADRYLGFAVRGSGTVQAGAGGRQVRVTATGSRWTWAHVRVRGRTSSAALRLTAVATEGSVLALGPVGTPAHGVRLSGLRVAGGRVIARVGPRATGLRVLITTTGGRVVGRGRVPVSGSISIGLSSGSGRAVVTVQGDATRTNTVRAVRLG